MTAEELFMVRCDAPRCDRTLETSDGRAIFHTLASALETATSLDWLVEHEDSKGQQKTYCPEHWHRVFGVGAPYWGAKERRRFT